MSEQTTTQIIVKLREGVTVVFNSQEDALLFCSHCWTFDGFVQLYRQVYPQGMEANQTYRANRTPAGKERFIRLVESTIASDGSLLADTMRRLYL